MTNGEHWKLIQVHEENLCISCVSISFCLFWLNLTYNCSRSLKGRLKSSVKGQRGYGDRGHQAGEQCWFVPAEKISQRLSALLFCRNSVDPLPSLFSVRLLWPAESRTEWEGEEKQCVDGLSGEGWQVEVSSERWGCDGMKAVGHMTLNSCSICVHCLERSRLPGHCLKMADFMCLMYVNLAPLSSWKRRCVAYAFGSLMVAGKCFALTFAFRALKRQKVTNVCVKW